MNSNDKDFVFVYGTLKTGEPNHGIITNSCFGKSMFIGRAMTLKKYPLVIATRFNIPCLLYSVGKGEHIQGELYEIDRKMLLKLDELECYPQLYERVKEVVKISDAQSGQPQNLKAWIYVMKDYKPWLLDLPYIQDYSSSGSHKMPYAPQYNLSPTEIFSDVKYI